MRNTSAPITCSTEPLGSADTVPQATCGAASTTKTTVSTPVTIVMTVCRRMITVKPSTPAPTTSAATTSSATTLVAVPPPHPSRSKTVAVASVARIVSAVSQPTVSSQEIAVGSLLPRTPYAARESTIVGAEPRLPASATMPQSRNENRIPTTPATTACPNRSRTRA